MEGKSHGGNGGGWDSRVEDQIAKTCILRRRPDCLIPGFRLAKISCLWEGADICTLSGRPAEGERLAASKGKETNGASKGYYPGIRYGIRSCGQYYMQYWTALAHEESATVAGSSPFDEQRRLLPIAGFDERAGLLYHHHVTDNTSHSEKSVMVQSQFQDWAFHKMEGD